MRFLVFALALWLPNAAVALSCMPYNAIAAFKDASEIIGRLRRGVGEPFVRSK